MRPNTLVADTKISILRNREIRKTIYQGEWWFVIEDVVLALIDSHDPKQYIQRMKYRDPELNKGWVQIVHTLPIKTPGGKQSMVCANTEGIFRIIQSIPSPKAEPFKRWLARVGYERVQEIEDPELGTKRTRALYKAKGYQDSWIEKRMRGIAIREDLTEEWSQRGAKSDLDYAILTNDIMKGAFNLTVSEYKQLKKFKRDNLRDHMVDLELILTMLGEATTTQLTRDRNSKSLPKLKLDAKEGGAVAGNTRRDIERRGTKVITAQNFKKQTKKLR
jgi:DNA-damage-inducible protein D